MTEKLFFLHAIDGLAVIDIDDGKMLRPATDDDKHNLPIGTDEEFLQAGRAMSRRLLRKYEAHFPHPRE